MEQTPCRVFGYGKDMLHVLFQLRPPPLIPKNAADFGKTRQNGCGFASRTLWKAYRYLRRHRRLMDYQGYRRRGLPIGSGVTEAGCKTVFTQRFKRSGMRWHGDTGQVILDLRVMHLSGIWEPAFA